MVEPAMRPGHGGRPGSITTAAQLGFVQAGLSALMTAGLLYISATLAADLEIGMGQDVWVIAISQVVVAAMLLSGALVLRSGRGRGLYATAAVLHIVNCLCWVIPFVFSPTHVLIPVLLAVLAVVGLVFAAKPASSEYLRAPRPPVWWTQD